MRFQCAPLLHSTVYNPIQKGGRAETIPRRTSQQYTRDYSATRIHWFLNDSHQILNWTTGTASKGYTVNKIFLRFPIEYTFAYVVGCSFGLSFTVSAYCVIYDSSLRYPFNLEWVFNMPLASLSVCLVRLKQISSLATAVSSDYQLCLSIMLSH